MARHMVEPRGAFALDEACRFLAGFGPAAHAAGAQGDHLHLALVPDGSDVAGGACVRADDGGVAIETFGPADADATRRQVERMLSLHAGANGFTAVAERDPVVGGRRGGRSPHRGPAAVLPPPVSAGGTPGGAR